MDRCQEKVIHQENVAFAVKNLPDAEIIQRLADTYKALGDPSRLKMVLALLACELCVCDLAAACDMSESAVSQNSPTYPPRTRSGIAFGIIDHNPTRTDLKPIIIISAIMANAKSKPRRCPARI